MEIFKKLLLIFFPKKKTMLSEQEINTFITQIQNFQSKIKEGIDNVEDKTVSVMYQVIDDNIDVQLKILDKLKSVQNEVLEEGRVKKFGEK